MTDDLSQRLERIEAHAAHLERQVDELNGVIIEQAKLLERLKKEVQKQSTLLQTQELENIKSNNPPPPHYE